MVMRIQAEIDPSHIPAPNDAKNGGRQPIQLHYLLIT